MHSTLPNVPRVSVHVRRWNAWVIIATWHRSPIQGMLAPPCLCRMYISSLLAVSGRNIHFFTHCLMVLFTLLRGTFALADPLRTKPCPEHVLFSPDLCRLIAYWNGLMHFLKYWRTVLLRMEFEGLSTLCGNVCSGSMNSEAHQCAAHQLPNVEPIGAHWCFVHRLSVCTSRVYMGQLVRIMLVCFRIHTPIAHTAACCRQALSLPALRLWGGWEIPLNFLCGKIQIIGT